MGQYDAPSGPPPTYSAPAAHGEAANYYGDTSAPAAPQGTYYPPQQGYASPTPDPNRGFMPPGQQQGYPPQGYPQQQGYPPQQGQPMYYQQQGYPPPQGYVQQQQGSGAGGICAGVLSALACCCCLDILF
ncbi:hypothetical protein E4T49_00094 [Aureobasidium sp. EXF-10728]|nr:hypothetical protein E4T49_00094 [Aureobasidium sp. EXF-10728]